MTRTLILMRHAKSSWNSPAQTDHARPLNPRGIRSARALGNWLRLRNWLPDQVICSSATRTRETLAGLSLSAPARFTDALYHAPPDQMRQVLEMATGRSVLMLGHNPGIAEFAERLVATPPNHPRFFDYPTGATTVIRFEIDDWAKLDWATGVAVDFTIPRDLPET